ncbi:F-box domain protein [Sporothrix schenckii 1099-18]|uniref:F-box domain-containing protein n=2 Tax=Sporothrix schenckii TaxID=29908 RepID=U7Q5Y4_SPOS1|nr:F-box domain protein [Sporothrix schenckii 1099-18]ERT03253.1 hypothetical protein HMPREF1624_01559 [Sporothrix schenckii ATCC 58251]KJR84318.1 F-box domain protein [Sporothrix schenckii 1099-18]
MVLRWLPNFRSPVQAQAAGSQASAIASSKLLTSGSNKTVAGLDPNADDDTITISPRPPRSLMSLPPELHIQIAKQLIYPDALSLKHSSRYFYNFVDTGIELKISWLMSRRLLHLDCPNDTRCDLGSDLRFCRGSVPLLMKRRREHIECESRPDLGCLIYNTKTCVHRRPPRLLRRWFRRRLTVEMWWIVLALIPLALSWLWFAELLFFL